MSFITTKNLTRINFELTDFCNAACPMCVRHDWQGNLKKAVTNSNHTGLELIKNKIDIKILSRLRTIMSCGTYGDAIMNPECLEIFEHFRRHNKNQIELYTNGGVRSKDFWAEMGKLGITVVFSIDGLEDTNHLYRRNVKWHNLYENVKTYLNNGGDAVWEFLIFKHNEHQVKTARELSKRFGFRKFIPKHTGRWKDYSDDGEYRDTDKILVDEYYLEKPSTQENYKLVEGARTLRYYKDKESNYKRIVCASYNDKDVEIYIRANGLVSPCCFLGDVSIHEASRLVDNLDQINLNKASLQEILSSNFFDRLNVGIDDENSVHRLNTCYSCCGVN